MEFNSKHHSSNNTHSMWITAHQVRAIKNWRSLLFVWVGGGSCVCLRSLPGQGVERGGSDLRAYHLTDYLLIDGVTMADCLSLCLLSVCGCCDEFYNPADPGGSPLRANPWTGTVLQTGPTGYKSHCDILGGEGGLQKFLQLFKMFSESSEGFWRKSRVLEDLFLLFFFIYKKAHTS